MFLHKHVTELIYNVHGCRVIQCILEHGSDQHRMMIFNEIGPQLLQMVQDRWGNYVIQTAIRKSNRHLKFQLDIQPTRFNFISECCAEDMRNYMIEFVLKDVIFLSANKYSSNVVEKCVRLATPLQQKQAMDLICALEPR